MKYLQHYIGCRCLSNTCVDNSNPMWYEIIYKYIHREICTLFRLFQHQTEFRLVTKSIGMCNYNLNLVWFNLIPSRVLCVFEYSIWFRHEVIKDSAAHIWLHMWFEYSWIRRIGTSHSDRCLFKFKLWWILV